MTRPPLTLALSSVLAAAIDHAGRPGLLATLHPEFGRTIARSAGAAKAPGLAQVIPMPRVIPLPRRGPDLLITTGTAHPDHPQNPDHPGPFSAA